MKPSIEKLLQQDVAPAPNPKARLAARQAAMAEFMRVQAGIEAPAAAPRRSAFQAFLDKLRLSAQSDRRDVMPWYSRQWLLGGAASVCLALLGGSLVWNAVKQDPRLAALPRAGDVPLPHSEHAPLPRQAAGTAAETTPVDSPTATAEPEPAPQSATEMAATREQRREAALADARRVDAAKARAHEERRRQASAEQESLSKMAAGAAVEKDEAPKEEQTEEVVVTGERRLFAPTVQTSPQAVVSLEESVVVSPSRRGRASGSVKHGKQAAPQASPAMNAMIMPTPPPPAPQEYVGQDKFEHFDVNPVKRAAEEPVSTFSADVDTASYSFVRRQLMAGVLPQKDAVRVEEMVNYFGYAWPAADSRREPFRPTVVVSDSPWGKGRKLVHIGIKGYEIDKDEQPDANLVLLLDVSGSMGSADRLPLAIQSMELLLGSLKPTDTVAIVVYAGAAGKVLDPTPVRDKEKILEALQRLQAGGSTAGAEGIQLAYELAESSFRKGGVNRILLCTDGDFNVGIASTGELKGYVEREREKGIFLSVLGYGMGNYRDEMAQALAQNGNGVAAYIDSIDEARKVLVKEATGSLFTIAKDVKLQVEFNPATVAEYRLVGYETRALKREDFNNDAVDAGDIGAGHTVTAIYEITPVGSGATMIDSRRYGPDEKQQKPGGKADEYGFLRIRYKLPDGTESKLLETPIRKEMPAPSAAVKRDVRFSTAVAGFAQKLRGGTYTGKLSYDDIAEEAEAARGPDEDGYRAEFVRMVRKARTAKAM